MTREVMGTESTQATSVGPTVDFDLGELRRAPVIPEAMPREPLTIRLAAWRTQRAHWWQAAVLALLVALLAAFVGWHIGGDRARGQAEAWTSANPPLVGWLVDNGPDLSSEASHPREDVELHLLNVGRDPVIIRSITATSDAGPVDVDLSSYTPGRVRTGETTIASLVLRTTCVSAYSKASLAVRLTRFDGQGEQRSTVMTVAQTPSLGQSLSDTLNGLCANPTRDFGDSGVDGLTIGQTSGTSGATLTVTNNADEPRQAEITSDESPAFELVSSQVGPTQIRPGQSVEFRLHVSILKCNAIVGLQDWASSLTLEVSRQGDSNDAANSPGSGVSYPLPDLILVPGGAAIQRACNP